ncbi:putative mediator of RNA polymerase II transcription subunit 26 isoform X2 [Daphnia carinata]|uniref:putative mediator of RNA polymerase II transcription subunit 26 isoform X2 n=1 Tax=Daphnia carinata TaxID=120202 RepID=UPI00257C2882|nr:putative mediator of RNA polymerase II transcription subunit 26 isoform X2 [Daphnia carinata]
MYPTREQFTCVRCKEKVFTSWNDFENHHAKHAVDFTFSKLPVVKLQQIQISSIKSKIHNLSPIANRNIGRKSPNSIVSRCSKNTGSHTKEPESSESKLTEQEDLHAWPGSCESSSPVASPSSTQIGALNKIVSPASMIAVELQVDSNILDPIFIEKLGEEISFLNQSSVDSITEVCVQKDSLPEVVQSSDVNLPSSSKSPIDFQAISADTPAIEQTILQNLTTEKNLALSQLLKDKPEDKSVEIKGNDALNPGNESPKEIELPKSKGQLRLVPFESLLSPSRLPVDCTEKETTITSFPVSPSKSHNREHAMVVIPERNLTELNISGQTALVTRSDSLRSSPVNPVMQQQQQVLQISRSILPPAVIRTMLPNPISSILPLPQQPTATQSYQFYHPLGQGRHHPQVYQQQKQQQQQQQQQPKQQHQQKQHQQKQHKQHKQQQAYNVLQYQQQPVYRPQGMTGQQQSSYATAVQYINRPSNQQEIRFPSQCYSTPTRAIQPNDFCRASVSTAMTFANHGSAHIHAVSTTSYLHQTTNNQVQSVPSSSHPQCQFPISNDIYNTSLHHTNSPLPHYPAQPSAPIVHHVQLQIPSAQSTRPSFSTAQTTVRQQTVVHPGQEALRHALTSLSGTPIRAQQIIQQRPGYVGIRPHSIRPQTSNNLNSGSTRPTSHVALSSQPVGIALPSTSTAFVATSSAIRLPQPYPRQQTSSAPSQPVMQKRLLTVEEGISEVCQPPRKIARAEEEVAASTSQPSGDCEVRIIQKKQTGLPVIQSVEGGINTVIIKASSQALQTPSVASLLSNPNITVTPAKNKENQVASETIASLKATSTPTSTTTTSTKTPGAITIDLTNTASVSLQHRNPLQCQVCNETFSSQSLLKNHLVLHLRKVRPATVRPTNSPPVARSLVSNQTLEVHSSTSRTYPSSQRGRTSESTMPSASGCVSVPNNSATSKQGTHPSVVTRASIDGESNSSATVMISNQVGAVDSFTSHTKTLCSPSGQTSSATSASTSSNVSINNKLVTGTKGLHSLAIVKTTTRINDDVVSHNQQSKSGEILGSCWQIQPANFTPNCTSLPVQPSATNEPNSPLIEKTTSSNEFYIPIVDLKREDVMAKLELMGINQFIPASNLTSFTDHGDFAIPVMSATAVRRAGTTGFPNLSGVINLGSPKTFPFPSK